MVSEADIEAAKSESEEATNEATAETPPAIDPKEVEASTDATPKSSLTEEAQKQLNQLMLDLRWLIVEGYVTEYGDGRLFAPAPMPEPKKDKPESDSGTQGPKDTASSESPEAEADTSRPDAS